MDKYTYFTWLVQSHMVSFGNERTATAENVEISKQVPNR
jgi:hypothetical protein